MLSSHDDQIFFQVLVPYLKNKCDAYYENLSAALEGTDGNEIQNNKYLVSLHIYGIS